MDQRDLFISHSSGDAIAARELRAELEAAGYSTWMAPDDVVGTDPWAEQILAAIQGSRAMLVLVSAHANASAHVSREVGLANGRNRAILPIRIEDVAPEGALAYHLEGLQRVDVFPPPISSHRERLLRRLARIVPLQSGTFEAAATPSAPTQVVPRAPAIASTTAVPLVATRKSAPSGRGAPVARVPREADGSPRWLRAGWSTTASILALVALLVLGAGVLVFGPAAGGAPTGPSGTLFAGGGSPSIAATQSTGPTPTILPSQFPAETVIPSFETIAPAATGPRPTPIRTPRPTPTPRVTKPPTAPPPTATPPPVTKPAKITSHASGSTLHGTSVTFVWTAASGAKPIRYYGVYVGSIAPDDPCAPGAFCQAPGDDPTASSNIDAALGLEPTVLSAQLDGLPANGSTIYVRLFTKYEPASGLYTWRDYTFTSAP